MQIDLCLLQAKARSRSKIGEERVLFSRRDYVSRSQQKDTNAKHALYRTRPDFEGIGELLSSPRNDRPPTVEPLLGGRRARNVPISQRSALSGRRNDPKNLGYILLADLMERIPMSRDHDHQYSGGRKCPIGFRQLATPEKSLTTQYLLQRRGLHTFCLGRASQLLPLWLAIMVALTDGSTDLSSLQATATSSCSLLNAIYFHMQYWAHRCYPLQARRCLSTTDCIYCTWG